MFRSRRGLARDPQGESRAFTKNGRKFAGTGAKKGCVRKGFPFAAEAGQQKKNCHRTLLGMQTDEDAEDKANALCFALATRLELPTPRPAGVVSLKRKEVLLIPSRDLALAFTATFRCVLVLTFVVFWWDGRRSVPARHRRCGRKKNASKTQDKECVNGRKVLPALLTQECA